MHAERSTALPEKGDPDKKTFEQGCSDSLQPLLAAILQTREVRTLLADALPVVLNTWAGEHAAKKFASRAIGRQFQTGLSRPGDTLRQPELPNLFEEPQNLQHLVNQLPVLLEACFTLAEKIGTGLEKQPPATRKQLLETLLTGLLQGRSGSLVTTWARVLGAVMADSPNFVKAVLEPGVTRWIQNTDFGELRELFDGLADSSGDLVKMVNDVLWRYPSKVVLLLSFLPGTINVIARTVNECLSRFNNLAPDLVADVVLSCFRDLDPRTLGQTVNELAELIRKLDTGSPLIGDSGVSGFERDLAVFLDILASSIDVEKIFRAREGLAAGKETLSAKIHEYLKDHPEITLTHIRRTARRINPGIKAAGRTADLIGDLPETETADAVADGLSQLDFSEIAEIINLTSLLTNRVRGHHPDLLSSMLSQILDSVDLDEVENAAQGLQQDFGESLAPLGRILLPRLICLAGDWLSAADAMDDPAVQEARQVMQKFLQPGEVNP